MDSKELDIRDFGYTTSNINSSADTRDLRNTLEIPELNIAPQRYTLDPQDKEYESKAQMPGIISSIRQSGKMSFADRGTFSGGRALEQKSVNTSTPFTRNTPIGQAYDKLSDGTYVPRYKNFIADTDNEERLARQQGFWSKLGNGVAKFAAKTLLYGASGVVNPVYGMIDAIKTGNFNAIYNNDFMKFMNDLDTRMNYALPNYYTGEEKNRSFLGKMGTANFWANDVLGGMAFTTGALVSEGIWTALTGGASVVGSAGRLGARLAGRNAIKNGLSGIGKRFFSDVKGVSNAYLRSASKASNVASALNNARFLYTSAGWEASVESYHFMKDAELNYVESFKNMYGRNPNAQELQEFRDATAKSGNGVFAANIGIVGLSNILQFGQYFGVGSDFTKSLDRRINKFFGVGVKMNKNGKLEQIATSKLHKGLGTAFNVSKRPFTEGVWEEGSQGVVSKAADAWIASRFDPDAAEKNLSFMESIGKGFAETYGTKEGRMEIGIGAIIGGLMGVAGGRATGYGGFTELQDQNSRLEAEVERYNSMDIPRAAINLSTRMAYTNQQIKAAMDGAAAENNGDKYATRQAYNTSLFTKFKMDYEFGMLDDSAKNFEHVINQMSDSDLAAEYNISEAEAAKMKEDIISDYNSRLKAFRASEKYAESLLSGSKKAVMRDYVSLNLFLGVQSYENMKKAAEDIGSLMNDTSISSAIMYYSDLSDEGRRLYKEKADIESEISDLEKEVQKINSQITEEGSREKYAKKAERLTELNDRIGEINMELAHQSTSFSPIDFVNRALNNDRGIVDPSILGSSFQVLKNLDSYIYALNKNRKTGDKARANLLNSLVEDFTQSYSDFRSVNDMLSRMQDPRFMAKEDARIMKLFMDSGSRFYEDQERRPEGVEVVDKDFDKLIDDQLADGKIGEDEAYTMKTFARMSERFNRPQNNIDIVSDELWNRYKANDPGSINALKWMVMNTMLDNMPISERMREVYNENKDEIDQMIKDRGDSPLQRLEALRRKVENIQRMNLQTAKEVNDNVINNAIDSEDDLDLQDDVRSWIKRYNELYNKLDADNNLSDDELNELVELERQINDFGSNHNVDNLIDFVEQNRLIDKGISQFAPTSSLKNYDDLVDHHMPEGKGGPAKFDNAQNIVVMTVKPDINGEYQVISGMKMQNFINFLADKMGAVEVGKKKDSEGARKVIIGDKEYRLLSGEHSTVMISNADIEDMQNYALSNGKGLIFTLQPALASANSREVLFYDALENRVSTIPTNVTYGNNGSDIIKDQDVLETKIGDRIIARIDFSDSYNRGLWNEYERALVKKNGAITDLNRDPDNKDFQDNAKKYSDAFDKVAKKVRNNLVIKLINNEGGLGKFVSVVKALTNSITNSSGGEDLIRVREKAFKDFVANAGSRKSGYMDIGTYRVQNTLPGRPTLNMSVDMDTNELKVSTYIMSREQAANQFLTVGYVLNGKVYLKSTGSRIDYSKYPFATQIINEGKSPGGKYYNTKIPVAVIKHPNGNNYVYPVDVIEYESKDRNDLINELTDLDVRILDREDIMDINTRAMGLGIDPSSLIRIAGTYDQIADDLSNLLEGLQNLPSTIDVGTWISSTRSVEDILTNDVMINLDMSSPFHAPKLVVDFSDGSVEPIGETSSFNPRISKELEDIMEGNDQTEQKNQINNPC